MRPFLLVLLVTLSFLGGMAVQHGRQPAPPTVAPREQLARLQGLADLELDEYYRLKDAEARYRKADELLGKMLQLFLADLGLRVSQQALRASRQGPPELPRTPPAPPAKPGLPPARSAEPPSSSRLPGWQKAERDLPRLDDIRSALPFLRRARIADLAQLARGAAPFTDRSGQLAWWNGSFHGRARVRRNGGYESWDIGFSLQASMISGKLRGELEVSLQSRRKVLENLRQRGELSAIREAPVPSQALLIRLSPKLELQAYYLGNLGVIAVNIYGWNEEAQRFEPVGSATLERVRS